MPRLCGTASTLQPFLSDGPCEHLSQAVSWFSGLATTKQCPAGDRICNISGRRSHQFEQDLKRPLGRRLTNAFAVAGEHVPLHPAHHPIVDGDVRQADRLRRASTARAGDACDRKTDVRTACSPCPGCHLGGALGAHRTVIEEHSVVNAQRVDLGTVGVRHEGCQEVI